MRMTPVNQRRETDALALPLEFELEQSGGRARAVLGGILLFLVVGVALLASAPISAVVVAAGAIKPVGEAVAVHHEQGGTVEAVLVSPGDVVEKDQPLLRLRGAAIASEIQELTVRRIHLALRVERLQAQLEGRAPRFEPNVIRAAPAAADNERRQFEAAQAALAAELATFAAQRATVEASMTAQREEALALQPALDAFDERHDMLEALVARGVIARSELYAVATQRSEARSRHASVIGQALASARELVEIDKRRASLIATKRAEAAAELTETLARSAETTEQLRRRRDRLARTVVRAPMRGAVQRLGGGELGAVLPPGALAAEIVPADRPLVGRVRVSPDQIGHVNLGDQARVHIATFLRTDHGEIDGRVTRISPTSFVAEDGRDYYEVELELLSRREDQADLQALGPGMTVSANMLGERSTVLAYLLKPFEKALDLAFTSH